MPLRVLQSQSADRHDSTCGFRWAPSVVDILSVMAPVYEGSRSQLTWSERIRLAGYQPVRTLAPLPRPSPEVLLQSLLLLNQLSLPPTLLSRNHTIKPRCHPKPLAAKNARSWYASQRNSSGLQQALAPGSCRLMYVRSISQLILPLIVIGFVYEPPQHQFGLFSMWRDPSHSTRISLDQLSEIFRFVLANYVDRMLNKCLICVLFIQISAQVPKRGAHRSARCLRAIC
jgi:hypothetical protein